MSPTIVRKIESNELEALPGNVMEWTSGFLESSGTKSVISSDAFDPDGCFIADEDRATIGYVAVTKLPRKNWMVIRYLSARHALSHVDIVEKLLGRALEFAQARKPEFLRATTPSLQPYVDVYKSFGFKPVRRDFRLTWDLRKATDSPKKEVDFVEVNEKTVKEASELFVESLHPYWDWRTEEQGGEEVASRVFREGFKKGERWLSAHERRRVIGLIGLIPDYYDTGHARFRGAFVIPERRGQGFGKTLMSEAVNWAKKLGQFKMTVYTFSYLDSLAPGALLYIKSGGKIESEFLQMQPSS